MRGPYRHTKIIATLGPATESKDMLAKLLENRVMWPERRRTARIFVETHRNWSSNILRYEPVYQRLLRGA